MLRGALSLPKDRLSVLASFLIYGWLFLSIGLCPVSAFPSPKSHVYLIPAFARKYSMPCSSCHEAWPKNSPFWQQF